LPLVAAELATLDICPAMSLRMDEDDDRALQ